MKFRSEKINHPSHYGGDTIYETIKVIEAWGINDFCLGNTIKYISRAGKKHKKLLEDLKKAKWYLDRKITNMENTNGKIQNRKAATKHDAR